MVIWDRGERRGARKAVRPSAAAGIRGERRDPQREGQCSRLMSRAREQSDLRSDHGLGLPKRPDRECDRLGRCWSGPRRGADSAATMAMMMIRDEEDANDGDSCMRRAMRSRSWSADARLRNGKEARRGRDTVSCMRA